ncbi:serine hydroxymethyltransferase [Spirochaetota bacterium]|nr:serine hydroxymethyltransferase [Spirochaetota bacterium]
MTTLSIPVKLTETIKNIDNEVFAAIEKERERQELNIELIASENAALPEVMAVQGSVLTNKYAEGYPTKRYYGGCIHVDEIEQLAIDRAKQLFGAEHANVQPHSGSQANMAVYLATLKPGDKILGMALDQGGHLTHGAPVSISGKYYEAHHYGINATSGLLEYDKIRDQAKKIRPKMIIAGASAYSRIIDFKEFRTIADEVGALLLVDMAHIAGLVAAGLHPSPVPYADFVTTTTHKTLRGPRGGLILTRSDFAKKINSAIFPGTQGGPLMHAVGAKALAFKLAMQPDFKAYQEKVIENAKAMAAALIERDFTIISNGTDNHLFLISLINKNVSGKLIERALETVAITLNKNAIPNDPRSPFITSGIRIGTPVVTTRNMGPEEMKQIAHFIDMTVRDPENESSLNQVRKEVHALVKRFPLYKDES